MRFNIEVIHSTKVKIFGTIPMLKLFTKMDKKSNTKVFTMSTIIEGNIVSGKVSFSPAPEPGIMTELARFEAQRIITHMVTEEIDAGRL